MTSEGFTAQATVRHAPASDLLDVLRHGRYDTWCLRGTMFAGPRPASAVAKRKGGSYGAMDVAG